jgi:hypothetical protein
VRRLETINLINSGTISNHTMVIDIFCIKPETRQYQAVSLWGNKAAAP